MGKSLILSSQMLISVLLLFLLNGIGYVVSKECTNVYPNNYAAHTYRYLLQTSKNETWNKEVYAQAEKHMNAIDDSLRAAAGDDPSVASRKMMNKNQNENQMEWVGKKIRFYDQGDVKGKFLKEVNLNDVRLNPDSMYGIAQHTNLEYLLMLDVDDLLWNFRKTAGFHDVSGHPYGGWEKADSELRGHFVGHYLSSTAQMWASTKNGTLREKITKAITILAECQKQMGTGYLSAFPSEFFDRFETLRTVWAPYYTIHKIMAGLLDQYTFAGSGEALRILKWMVDYHYERVMNTIQKYSIQRHWNSLNEEVGGMNDVLYRLYAITGNKKHLTLAHLFDKPCFLGELAMEADDVSSYHANTHIPLVIGAQMRYEVTGDPLYRDISTYFVDMINSSHTYATGGTSESEHWTDPKRLASTLTTDTQESCTTYNMLKVIRNMFRWTKDTRYADYYERALINGVLPIQRGTEPGVMIYFLPQKPGGSKAISYWGWGKKHNSMWCCYGSATESFAKLGDTIYFEEEGNVPRLYVAQYIPNTFHWETLKVKLQMNVKPVLSTDDRFRVTIAFDHGHKKIKKSTLNLRIPVWTDSKMVKAKLNHYKLQVPEQGSFLSITRAWKHGDQIKLDLPISLHLERIRDDRPEYASLQAIFFGPYLLAGLSKGDKDINAAGNAYITDWITPVPEEHNRNLISLSLSSGNAPLYFAASAESVKLQNSPNPGTTEAADSTLRVILKDPSKDHKTPWNAMGESIMLEPFGYPNMLVAHQGANQPLHLVTSSSNDESSVFKLVPGLDGTAETVSFQSANKQDCYILSGSGNSVNLGCRGGYSGDFGRAASFKMDKGISEYHPLSFVAKGGKRSFLFVPLLSLKDEHYTLYFNI